MVPVDDTHTVTIGWRIFRDELDPQKIGDASKVGKQSIDFVGQTEEERSYEQRQRFPGDYEVQVSQRAIAVHANENLATSDRGVATLRRLIRHAIRAGGPARYLAAPSKDGVIGTYCQDTVWPAPANSTPTQGQLAEFGQRVAATVLDSGDQEESGRRLELRQMLETAYPLK